MISANLWHDWPRHRRLVERLEEFAMLVEREHADVVLLQEVARTQQLRVDEWLSKRLDMGYIYTRANGHQGGIGFEEGLAVFSRFRLSAPRVQELGTGKNPFVRRLALAATVHTPCGKLITLSVHLGLFSRRNAEQMAALQDWVGRVAGNQPALVGGDFNAHEASPQIKSAQSSWLDAYRQLNPGEDGATHELRWPWGGILKRARLDYIFLRQGSLRWKVMEARHLTTPGEAHSDHRAVLARLAPARAPAKRMKF